MKKLNLIKKICIFFSLNFHKIYSQDTPTLAPFSQNEILQEKIKKLFKNAKEKQDFNEKQIILELSNKQIEIEKILLKQIIEFQFKILISFKENKGQDTFIAMIHDSKLLQENKELILKSDNLESLQKNFDIILNEQNNILNNNNKNEELLLMTQKTTMKDIRRELDMIINTIFRSIG
jgi:hypothetical protein